MVDRVVRYGPVWARLAQPYLRVTQAPTLASFSQLGRAVLAIRQSISRGRHSARDAPLEERAAAVSQSSSQAHVRRLLRPARTTLNQHVPRTTSSGRR